MENADNSQLNSIFHQTGNRPQISGQLIAHKVDKQRLQTANNLSVLVLPKTETSLTAGVTVNPSQLTERLAPHTELTTTNGKYKGPDS